MIDPDKSLSKHPAASRHHCMVHNFRDWSRYPNLGTNWWEPSSTLHSIAGYAPTTSDRSDCRGRRK